MNSSSRLLPFLVLILLAVAVTAFGGPADDATWRYVRPGNTGVQGDYSDALWIDPDGMLYLGGYVPTFEEGGFARYHAAEDLWENFSNVDHPVIGDPANVGSSRISVITPDAQGVLWMGTWRGLLVFDPAVGASSLRRFDAFNSPLPGGRTMDVSVAPDGTVWLASFSVSWGFGGVARFDPVTEAWTVWGSTSGANGWPGWQLCETVAVQPKPGGGYMVWIDDSFGVATFDSDTQQFTVLPSTDTTGEVESINRKDACDAAGNLWALRFTQPGQPYSLDYRRMDGTWVTPPQPFANVGYDLGTFRAFGDRQALLVDGMSRTWHFDGSVWHDLGVWRTGGFTFAVDMDAAGNVWVSGNGGAGRRDAQTGVWQRYRLTNTGLLDYFPRDISLSTTGELWVTANGGPGLGGIGSYDGKRWFNYNGDTSGQIGPWPFPTDNADALVCRADGNVAVNPMFNGIREWTGAAWLTHETGSQSEGLAEDSLGRLWTVGTYFSLRYLDGTGFHPVTIAGWGANVVPDPSRAGTVWACANLEVVRTDGSYYFSRENTDFPELNPQHDVLTTVAAAPDGSAWVGSTEGLFHVDPATGAHQWFHPGNSDLPGALITPLIVTPDGVLWCTNFGSDGFEAGLVWYDGTRFGTITTAQGLPHAQIYDAETRLVDGGYELWLCCASRGLAVLTVATDQASGVQAGTAPAAPRLLGAHPNPFNPQTTLSYEVPAAGPVHLEIFDMRGRNVRVLVEGLPREAGQYRAEWDGRDDAGRPLPSGMYLARMRAGAAMAGAKLMLAR